jgi:hypothetical protein
MRWMGFKVRPPVSGNIVHGLHCIAFVGSMNMRTNSLHLYFELDMSLPEG